jgi:hypothetical protein
MEAGGNGVGHEDPDGRWMSYTELAEARKISASSALRLVLRRKWRRQKDNHGITRALVPPEWAAPAPGKDFEPGAYVSQAISALEYSITTLRERAEVAERTASIERDRANRAIEARDAERSRANLLREKIDTLQFDLFSTQSELQTSQTEIAERDHDAAVVRDAQARWRSAGTVARLLWAWRGILPDKE